MELRRRTADEIRSYVEGFNYCYKMFCEYLGKSQNIGETCEKMDEIRSAVSLAIITEREESE